jgi:hypothetical protein
MFSRVPHSQMSTTQPIKLSSNIIDQLRDANLDIRNAILAHYNACPREGTASQLDIDRARTWCDLMDTYLVRVSTISTKQR